MGRAAARPGGGYIFSDWMGHLHGRRAIGDDRHRLIAETKSQPVFVQEFPPRQYCAALTFRASHGHGVGQSCSGDGLGERLALGVVAIEKRIVRLSAEYGGYLPRQIVNILHSGVETEAAGRRHLMGGIPARKTEPSR